MITVEDILGHLVARTNAPSTLGAQLDHLATQTETKDTRSGFGPKAKAPQRPVHNPEGLALRHAEAFRCISNLGRIRAVDLEVEALVAIAAESGQTIGRIVVRTLRAFQEALAAPTDEDITRATKRAQRATDAYRDAVFQRALAEYRAHKGIAAVQREYTGKDAGRAAELYADCFLVLSMYVQQFNRKQAA